MSFKDRKRDDHGHVIGNDEVDGQECKHASGQADKVEDQKYNKEMQAAQNQNADMREAFDDDYEEEFNEPSPEDEKQYVDKCMEDIAKASNKKAFEYVADNIDELEDAGLISGETADRLYNELDKKIDESGERMPLFNTKKGLSLEDAINMADDDVLDEQFGKDTPERKLAGAIKEGKPEDFAKKTAKMPNGKEMSLFDFAHNIVNYLDTDTAATIIASKYGVSEADAKAYLESPYNTEGNYKEKLNASNKKQKYKEINGIIYPVDADGKIDKDNKFPNLKAFKDVYGENVEEDK